MSICQNSHAIVDGVLPTIPETKGILSPGKNVYKRSLFEILEYLPRLRHPSFGVKELAVPGMKVEIEAVIGLSARSGR
jgi:hypothetical protein